MKTSSSIKPKINPAGPVSIHEIARLAGVSPGTVSRAFNNRTDISETTRQKILKLAEKLNYRPNQNARYLVRGKTDTIAVIVPDLHNPFLAELSAKIEFAARNHHFFTNIMISHQDISLQKELLTRVLAGQADGIIIVPIENSQSIEMINEVRERVPIVALKGIEGLHCDTVMADDRVGMEMVIRHLRDLGHQSIAYITPKTPEWTVNLRQEGCLEAKVACQLEQLKIFYVNSEKLDIYQREELKTFLQQVCSADNSEKPITAIIAYDDLLALQVAAICREIGFRIPKALSLCGFDDIELTQLAGLEFTTVSFDVQQIAEIALDLLQRRVSSTKQPNGEVHIRITPILKVRKTTGPISN